MKLLYYAFTITRLKCKFIWAPLIKFDTFQLLIFIILNMIFVLIIEYFKISLYGLNVSKSYTNNIISKE